MKRVSCRIVKTSPFVERRVRRERLKIKYRRAEDNTQSNFSENQIINPDTYKFSLKGLKTDARDYSRGKIIDCYA